VSPVSGRAGESFASPDEQRQRIEAECKRDGLDLLDVIPEMDVSGGTPLEKREALRTVVERIEAGEAQVIVAAYFDRLCRSLRVQDELVSRVEKVGGQVLAVDVGQVRNGSAGQWLSGTLLGAVNEYQRRTTTERTAGAQAHAVARGAQPWARVALGYLGEVHFGELVNLAACEPIMQRCGTSRAGPTLERTPAMPPTSSRPLKAP